jgi:ornithine cyclodeaminase
MRIVELPEILAAIDEEEVMATVEEGFRRFSRNEAEVLPVGHLAFDAPPGDCHLKGAYLRGDDVFVVKLTNSFYRNDSLGLPTGNGFNAVVSARTGAVEAILHDKGQLTDIRTAATGALAARAIARPGSATLGIVGAGMQARLQAKWIARALGITRLLIWSRDGAKAEAFAAEMGAETATIEALCAAADIIVTTTPATDPLVPAALVRPGTRIIAIGADAPGKRELDVSIFQGAHVICDSRAQCIDHGETSWAVAAGLVREDALIELGELFAASRRFPEDETVIVDMTGVAIQDLQISKAVWARISQPSL